MWAGARVQRTHLHHPGDTGLHRDQPNDDDFGSVKLTCRSPVRTFTLRNVWHRHHGECPGLSGSTDFTLSGGPSLPAALTSTTVLNGMADVRRKAVPTDLVGVRRKGAGNRPIETLQPGIHEALESLVDPVTRGDPMSPLRWTSKSTRALATELGTKGFSVTQHTVGAMLGTLGYSLQATKKTLEGEAHPDRDAQFRHINAEAEAFQARGQPVISVDTKKKELVGTFHNRGREWQPAGAPVLTNTHDFPGMAIGKAIPYGVYDLATNKALVSVGLDHDTPVFAVNSIRAWWTKMGSAAYPKATELLVTADAGGSNGYRARLWKATLQVLASDLGIAISVVHFPPGTSKWNKIEHRLFSHISLNWRGRPLEDYETVVQLIGSTRTRAGLKVSARLDRRKYQTGKKVPEAVMSALNLTHAAFHGEWNYTLHPEPIG
jgi:hypothetical protein